MRAKAIVHLILSVGISRFPRSAALIWFLGFLVVLQFASATEAEPRLQTDALIGPLADFFAAKGTQASLGSPGYLLGADYISRNLFNKEVEVDSTLVKYMLQASGAPGTEALGRAAAARCCAGSDADSRLERPAAVSRRRRQRHWSPGPPR